MGGIVLFTIADLKTHIAEFGWPCGNTFIPNRSKCWTDPKTGRRLKKPMNYQVYQKIQQSNSKAAQTLYKDREQAIRDRRRAAVPGWRKDGRSTDTDGRLNSVSDRRVSAKAEAEKIIVSRPELTKPGNPDIIPERLRKFLTPTQQQGVSLAVEGMDKHGGFLIADGTGVGKTREILAIADIYAKQGKKVVVVSPNEVLKPDYKKGTVTGSFAKDGSAMSVDTQLSKGDKPLEKGIVSLTTYQNLNALKKQVDQDTVVLFDEAHAFKNVSSERTKHGMEIMKQADKVLYATATPVDKPEHLPYLARAGVFNGNKPEVIYKWMGLQEKKINIPNGKTITKWEIPKGKSPEVYERMTGLFDDMTESGKMVKREISMKGVDVGFSSVPLPDSAYKMLDDIAANYDKEDATGLDKAQMLMQQRRQLEPFKIPAAVDKAKEAIKRGDQAVIFVSRVNESEVKGDDKSSVAKSLGTAGSLVDALKKEGIEVTELHGGTKTKADKAMSDFQSGKAKVIVATIESGGTGINLDDIEGDKPRTLIMVTPPFSAVENVQAVGRVWRMTTKTYPKIEYLFTDTDVDAWNREIIAKKMKTLGATTKGESGILSPNAPQDYSDSSVSSQSPRPPKGNPIPPGFIVNKYDGRTPDGKTIKAGEGYVRNENGRWVTYDKDSIDPITGRKREKSSTFSMDIKINRANFSDTYIRRVNGRKVVVRKGWKKKNKNKLIKKIAVGAVALGAGVGILALLASKKKLPINKVVDDIPIIKTEPTPQITVNRTVPETTRYIPPKETNTPVIKPPKVEPEPIKIDTPDPPKVEPDIVPETPVVKKRKRRTKNEIAQDARRAKKT